ncbi:MAG: glycosyltransferase family 39 protein [Bacilli bacterium]|nr:glycosyltransferase family 39 protein [Bacilli bacterium]
MKDMRVRNILYYITLFLVILFLVFLAVKQCLNTSLWFDELFSIKFITRNQPFMNIFHIFTSYEVYNLPLYSIFLFFFYRIFNYTKFSLLIPGMIFSIIGVIFLLRLIRNYFGKKVVILIAILIVCSSFFITNIFWEIRCYGLLFMLSSIFVYSYIRRLGKENIKSIIILGIIGIFLSFTHWFGGILILLYFLTDVYLFLRKRINIKCFLSYFMIAIFFIPWIILIILNRIVDISTFWLDIPNLLNIITSISYIFGFGNNYHITFEILYFIIFFLLAFILIFVFDKNKLSDKLNIHYHMILIFLGLVFTIYFYSVYVNPKVSLFNCRYFIVILPHGYFILASLFYKIFNCKKYLNYILVTVIIIPFAYFLLTNTKSFVNWDINYDKLADFLIQDNDISNPNCVVVNNTNFIESGFVEFYFENKNISIPNHHVNYIEQDELLEYDIVYYIYDRSRGYNNIDYDIQKFLNNNYHLVNFDLEQCVYKYVK